MIDIYIYIYRERERCIHIYIYIYIHTSIVRARRSSGAELPLLFIGAKLVVRGK